MSRIIKQLYVGRESFLVGTRNNEPIYNEIQSINAGDRLGGYAFRLIFALLILLTALESNASAQGVRQSISFLKLNGPDGGTVWDLEFSPILGPVAATSGGVYAYNDSTQAWRHVGSLRGVSGGLVNGDNSQLYVISAGVLYEWSGADADWKSIDLPDGLAVTSVAATGERTYVGTRDGLYRSKDDGSTWEILGLSGKSISDVEVVGQSVLATTDDHGVYRSEDGGDTWNQMLVGSFRLLYQGKNHVYAGEILGGPICRGTLWRSSDEGATWQKTGFDCRGVYSVLETSDSLLVGSDDGVFSSRVHDVSHWDASGLARKVVHGLIESNSGVMAGTGIAGVFLRSSLDLSWTPLSSGIAQAKVVRVHPDGHGRVFVGIAGVDGGPPSLCWTADEGSSWTCGTEGLAAHGVRAVVATGTDEFYAGTDAGVFQTVDGGSTWSPLQEGMEGKLVLDLAAASDGALWAATQSGVFRLAHPENVWRNIGLRNVFDLEVRGDTVYAASLDNGLVRSIDHGHSWQTLLAGIHAYRVRTVGSRIFLGTFNDGLYESTDAAKTWVRSTFFGSGTSVWALATASDSTLFVGVREGVFYSPDGGMSWKIVGFADREVNDLAVAPNGYLYVGIDNDGVYRSTNRIVAFTDPEVVANPVRIQAIPYPNPTDGDFYIELSSSAPNTFKIELFDLLGRRVEVLYEGLVSFGQQRIDIKLRDHPSGTYYIRVRSGGSQSFATLTVSR